MPTLKPPPDCGRLLYGQPIKQVLSYEFLDSLAIIFLSITIDKYIHFFRYALPTNVYNRDVESVKFFHYKVLPFPHKFNSFPM